MDQDIDILQKNWDHPRSYRSGIKLNSIEMKKAIQKNFPRMKNDGERHIKMLEKEGSLDPESMNANMKTKSINNQNGNTVSTPVTQAHTTGGSFFDAIKRLDTSVIMIKVQNVAVPLRTILNNTEKYESEMTNDEYLKYDAKIVELGITTIE